MPWATDPPASWTIRGATGAAVASMVASTVAGGPRAALVAALAVAAVAAAVDARTGRLPNRLVGLVTVAGVLAVIAASAPTEAVRAAGAGAACFAGPLFATHLAGPAAVGMGDVKLAAGLGIAIGPVDWRLGTIALCVASGSTALFGVATRRRSLPLGPGLVLGAIVAASIGGSVGA